MRFGRFQGLQAGAPECVRDTWPLQEICIAVSIPHGEGRGDCMHKSHKAMRVDVSLPPGIMRDRALAERDFVTFPEIFFFSVLSNRCRAMWEAGSLDGLEELSVLSTHSLRPFIWSKCSEKLPTGQRRRDKHIEEHLGEQTWIQEERRKVKCWQRFSHVTHIHMVLGQHGKHTTGLREGMQRRKRWDRCPLRLHPPCTPRLLNF